MCPEMQVISGSFFGIDNVVGLAAVMDRISLKKNIVKTGHYARLPEAGSIPVGWFRIVRSFIIV